MNDDVWRPTIAWTKIGRDYFARPYKIKFSPKTGRYVAQVILAQSNPIQLGAYATLHEAMTACESRKGIADAQWARPDNRDDPTENPLAVR